MFPRSIISRTSPELLRRLSVDQQNPAILRNKFKYCKIIAKRKKDEDALYFDQNVKKKKKKLKLARGFSIFIKIHLR